MYDVLDFAVFLVLSGVFYALGTVLAACIDAKRRAPPPMATRRKATERRRPRRLFF